MSSLDVYRGPNATEVVEVENIAKLSISGMRIRTPRDGQGGGALDAISYCFRLIRIPTTSH